MECMETELSGFRGFVWQVALPACQASVAAAHWCAMSGAQVPHAVMATHQRNGRETISWESAAGAGAESAVVQSIDLQYYPQLANATVYFAMEASVAPVTTQLSLLIDPGSGRFQVSNASSVICLGSGSSKRDEGEDCSTGGSDGFVMRSYQAKLQGSGIARFAVMADGKAGQSSVQLSGIAIAEVGARWESLTTAF